MKKFFTLVFATMLAGNMMAQMHGALTFAGASTMSVLTQNTENASDTVKFEMASMSAGNITLPAMKGMATIPSFTIKNVAFTKGDNHVITMAEQPFEAQVTVDGVEKAIKGSSVSGTYNMADNSLTLKAVFQYGAMPFPMTYNIKSYYVKAVTSAITVNVGGMFPYANEGVTYNVRKYMDGDVQKVDVEIPTYKLDNTLMGNLTLGTYTVKGLTYDEEKGGFYRDYKNDGLSFHFTAEKDGNKSMDGEYGFNTAKDNNILVKYDGSKITDIVNTFQMGAMPFGIVSSFNSAATGISSVKNDVQKKNDGKMYNLNGQVVSESYKGVVIVNGKKYFKK
ncbi:calycin-like domain-containing protein [Segatella copri]|uniref:calycin-like domain-containing protein n=1 Tax=Segatella copri TaxID=165179 RepID=UPI001C46AF8B|nr:calycin-like domain-containing protein [Segatella copri]WOZ83901.1 calycin-like domain-containing protein [Segatella copri]